MTRILNDQLTAAIVKEGIERKEQLLIDKLTELNNLFAEKTQSAYTALNQSVQCIENVRDFVSSPKNILGSVRTKHGEIAEHVEVEIRRGRDYLKYLKPTATFEGVGRTAPEDYIINGSQIQSKFHNSAVGSLESSLNHLKGYSGFAEKGYYHIPKDQYELLTRVLNNENLDDVSTRSINKLNELVQNIERESGKNISEVVQPGISNYSEVQLGKVGETLDKHEQVFRDDSSKEINKIGEEHKSNSDQAYHITDPSWGEALKFGAISATISGVTSASIKVYSKTKEGKKIQEFTLDDWKEVGYDFSRESLKGGVRGMGIYGLTKLGRFNAPFAGATVSTVAGIASLALDYQKGSLTKNEFSESACSISVEAGISAIGASIGQAIIPIPILGAIIGVAASNAALQLSKYVYDGKEKELIEQMQKEYDLLVNRLDKETKAIIKQMDEYYDSLGSYINAALSKESAVRFHGSIDLCKFLNVPESLIIHSVSELDGFMLA